MSKRKLAIRLGAPLTAALTVLVPLAAQAQSGLASLKFLGKGVTVQIIIANLIKLLLGFMGSITLLMFVYSGVTWMLAAGNAEKVKRAKDTMVWATLGLVAVFGGYVVFRIIFFVITGKAN